MPSAHRRADPHLGGLQGRRIGLLLDADGTLWDTRSAMETAGSAAARVTWPDVDEDVAVRVGMIYRSDPTGAFRRFAAGELTFEDMLEARLRHVTDVVGLRWADSVTADFEAGYRETFAPSLRAYPDMAPLLRWCRDRGVPVRVLTNSTHDYTAIKVASLGLEDELSDVCSRDCLGVGKPEAAVFQHACDVMGLRADEVLYVGDEWTSDAWGARQASLASAWLVRDDGDPAGEVVATEERRKAAAAHGIPIISTLADVPTLLGDLRGEGAGR